MAYRSWHRDGGRPPPPPYSKHKYSAAGGGASARHAGYTNATTTNTSVFTGDSKFSAELFKDMSKKIAHLTKVVCSLTNKVEDQELVLQTAKSEHEEKVKNLQSDLQQKIEEYKNKVKALEVLLQEEQKHILTKEKELRKLKQFCAFAENWRFFNETLIHSSKDKTSIGGCVGDSEDCGNLRLEFGVERCPGNFYLDSKLIFPPPSAPLKNGGSEFTFIGNKLRDMESYEKEVRFLIDACERLKAEKMALQTKYESEFHEIEKRNDGPDTRGKEDMLFGAPDGSRHPSELRLKEQLEKQDLQYRKRISDLLQCLTQSESRAEKYRKEIKLLEETLSSKENQNSLMTIELSKTLDLLKQSRKANDEIQEVCSKQSQELLTKSDLIAKLEDDKKKYENQLSFSKLESEQLREQLKESQQGNAHLQQLLNAKENDFKGLELLINKLTTEQMKTCEQLQKDFELRIKSTHDNYEEERRKLSERIESLTKSSLQKENTFLQQLEDTKMRYELHLEDERLVHREIQDNLEQQLDLLHRNVQHTIRNEEEEVATLHLLLGDKEVSLNKSQKQLKEARELADRMRRLIKLKEMELEKVRQQQKFHHSTEIRFTLENSHLSSSSTKQPNMIHEFPIIFARNGSGDEKQKFLKGRIEFLEEQTKVLRMEKDEMRKTHILELEAHKKELEKLKQELLSSAQDGGEISRKLTEEHNGKRIPQGLSGDDTLQDYSAEMKTEIDRQKCAELQAAMTNMAEESFSEKEKLHFELNAERDQVKKLTSLVETLQMEHGRVVVEREAKMNEVLRVRSEASQQIKNLESYWQERLLRELKKASHSFETEKQKLVSHFNKGQRLLKDKIALLQSIMKDLKDRKLKHESEDERMETFQELHKTIADKNAIINKLKEEKKALHIELLNQRDNSAKASSSQTLDSSIENMFALKKPRLERPPLTPQLVRRHSLLGSPEQKWLRARSQSPMRGFQPESTSTSKPTLPTPPVHRSSWTGEISDDLYESISSKNDTDTNTIPTAKTTAPIKDTAYSTENKSSQKEQAQHIGSEQEKFPVSQHSHESISNHICDTIAECDELLMTIEEEDKQSTLALKEEKLEVKDWAGNQIMESEV